MPWLPPPPLPPPPLPPPPLPPPPFPPPPFPPPPPGSTGLCPPPQPAAGERVSAQASLRRSRRNRYQCMAPPRGRRRAAGRSMAFERVYAGGWVGVSSVSGGGAVGLTVGDYGGGSPRCHPA